MIEIDANQLFNDNKYRSLMCEYHTFVGYIVSEFNRWNRHQITCSSVKFHEESDIYELRDNLIEMLKKTFPKFEVSFEKCGEHYDLDENEYSITVSWKNYNE